MTCLFTLERVATWWFTTRGDVVQWPVWLLLRGQLQGGSQLEVMWSSDLSVYSWEGGYRGTAQLGKLLYLCRTAPTVWGLVQNTSSLHQACSREKSKGFLFLFSFSFFLFFIPPSSLITRLITISTILNARPEDGLRCQQDVKPPYTHPLASGYNLVWIGSKLVSQTVEYNSWQ